MPTDAMLLSMSRGVRSFGNGGGDEWMIFTLPFPPPPSPRRTLLLGERIHTCFPTCLPGRKCRGAENQPNPVASICPFCSMSSTGHRMNERACDSTRTPIGANVIWADDIESDEEEETHTSLQRCLPPLFGTGHQPTYTWWWLQVTLRGSATYLKIFPREARSNKTETSSENL